MSRERSLDKELRANIGRDMLDATVSVACVYAHWIYNGQMVQLVGEEGHGRMLLPAKRERMKREDMEEAFQQVGRRFGFVDVEASYYPFKEFKTTWQRIGSEATFKVTDYLQNADQVIIQDFAACLFTRIQKQRREVYTPRVRDYLRSDEFVHLNQEKYLRRSRNLTFSSFGDVYDLDVLLSSLRRKGLVENGQDTFLSWTDKPNRFRMGYCSVLMKVVAISSALDRKEVPDYVAEYVLYHEMLHLKMGTDSMRSYHDADFKREERRYPRWREAENWLKKVALDSVV